MQQQISRVMALVTTLLKTTVIIISISIALIVGGMKYLDHYYNWRDCENTYGPEYVQLSEPGSSFGALCMTPGGQIVQARPRLSGGQR